MLISPSILASDFSRLGSEIKSMENARADFIHIDVMDGIFVPNITIGLPVIESVRKVTKTPFDVHLMIEKPSRYVIDFIKAGADIITFHQEAEEDINETINKINSRGAKVGIAIKPDTPAESVFPYLNKIYMVLCMTVEPGFGGQKFIPETMEKVKKIRKRADDLGLNLHIEVDGGINKETAKIAAKSGADILVAGSYIFNAEDRALAIKTLKER